LLAVLGGCSSTEAGTPAGPAGAAPADPIPAVQEPRDVTGIAPCDLATPEQLAAVGIDQPGQVAKFEEISGIPSCVWRDAARTREVYLSSLTGVDVLSNIYAQRDTYAEFEVTEIAGYPAVRTQNISGGTSCFLDVGVAEMQSFDVRFTSIGAVDIPPCPEAERIAEMVVGSLPPLN